MPLVDSRLAARPCLSGICHLFERLALVSYIARLFFFKSCEWVA